MAEEEEILISRPYQRQLEEIAVRKNTLIHLPTGSGKTHIAISLIARFKEALQRPWGQGGKRTFFLVNTVPLVEQQKKYIQRRCPVKSVAGFSGEDKCDFWDKAKWNHELSNHQVIVMTSQILLDMLIHDYIRIEDINLLIFDECQHAVSDHPMRMIMKQFEMCPVEKHPRVLGLTATLLNANVTLNNVQQTLRELETTFHATIATVNVLGEVLVYSTNPSEKVVFYRPPVLTNEAKAAIDVITNLITKVISIKLPRVNAATPFNIKPWQRDITTDPLKIVKNVKNMCVAMCDYIKDMGNYGGALSILAYTILLERLKRKAQTSQETLLYNFVITGATKARKILLHAMENDHGYKKILNHSSEQILKLLEIIKEYNPNVIKSSKVTLKINKHLNPLSAIIFTKQRFTAKILYNLLKDVTEENPKDFGFLKHDYIVGFNVNPNKFTREETYAKKCSQKALLEFANKDLNCLIATNVIEEGIDIPQCLLIVKYDPPLEYRSYVQSKGRARNSESSFVMLINETTRDKFDKQYLTYRRLESYLQKMLDGNCEDRSAPSLREIERELYKEDDIPPYKTENGNLLTSVSAISLLNRYCSTLPRDQYTTITPLVIEETVKIREVNHVLITIILPIASPVKENIKGTPKCSLKLAKRSAALNACIRLHQEGELDPITLLPKKPNIIDFSDDSIKECFPNWPWDEPDYADDDLTKEERDKIPKPGSKKRVRKHPLQFPKCLNGVTKWDGRTPFYLHVIKLTVAFEKPKSSREKSLYDLLKSGNNYGFITAQPLPKICDFPTYLTVGEVHTSIQMNHAVVKLDIQTFELVKRFHYFLFDQVLNVAKKFLCFDGSVNAMFAVPIVDDDAGIGYDIDWNTMTSHNEIRHVLDVPTIAERKALRVNKTDYKYSVVTPWYRGVHQAEMYIVSDVIEYKTPDSCFNSIEHSTFAEYYFNKYNLEIVGNRNQPLLEVRNITSGMNCLMPRAATLHGLSEKQQKLISIAQGEYKKRGFDEFLVPEFCIKYDYPGDLWFKAMTLPSIFHRVYMLLTAYELRLEITKYTKYGLVVPGRGDSWKPIEINTSIAVDSLLSQIEEPSTVLSVDRLNNPEDQSAPRKKALSMKESLYQLLKKKLALEYPWEENSEPLDIERNLSSVTVMDIECYNEFVSSPLVAVSSPGLETSSVLARPVKKNALTAPPIKYYDQIRILSLKPVGLGPELRDLLAALTSIKSNDIMNLERAETLGDSFLKYMASLYLFHRFPKYKEGQLTNIKGRLIGNRNLYYAGERINLGGRMKLEHFGPRKDFLLPGFLAPMKVQDFMQVKEVRPTFLLGIELPYGEVMRGNLSKESWENVLVRYNSMGTTIEREPKDMPQNNMQCYIRQQAVADKTIADCVEALIGTYLLSGGLLAGIKVLEWLRVLPEEHNAESLLCKKLPTLVSMEENPRKRAELISSIDTIMNNYRQDVQEIIGYNFKDPSFLLEALSHPSYIRNRYTPSYERMEFIGDAILDFLITAYIFENYEKLKPGDLTDLRSALVNNVTFAAYVVKLGLHKYLCSQLNPALEKAISQFVEHQEATDHSIEENVLYLIDEEDCSIAEYVEVPKVLSDLFESLIGAIYMDSGGDLELIWRVVYKIMYKEIHAFSMAIPKQPVRMLYENTHACPMFLKQRVSKSDPTRVIVPVEFTKIGERLVVYGAGKNKSQAKRAAAKLALRILET